MGAELDRRHASRPGHPRRDPTGKLDHDDAHHRRHHRLSVHAAHRRALGPKRRAVYLFPRRALLSVPTTFLFAKEFNHAVLASPVMGFFAAGVTTAFAIYFPELFPTKIRATAQGFCFNFARFFSAAGPLLAGATDISPRLLRAGNSHHRVEYISSACSFYFSPAKPKAKLCRNILTRLATIPGLPFAR